MKQTKDKQGDITLICEFCRKPIDQVSIGFGMDCINHCAEKQYNSYSSAIYPLNARTHKEQK